MFLSLTISHIDTICQLKEIAERHGCKIRIDVGDFRDINDGVKSIFDFLLEQKRITEEIKNEVIRHYDFHDEVFLEDYVCFELIENWATPTRKYHRFVYSEYEMHFHYDESWSEELSAEADTWVRDSMNVGDESYEGFWSERTADVKIMGFDTVDKTCLNKYRNVYREGVALKNFGDLVCDYLKEPRIIKTY